MKLAEIRKLKVEDLMVKASDTRVEIAELKRRLHMGESTNVRAIRGKRKELARMLTVISEQLAKEKI